MAFLEVSRGIYFMSNPSMRLYELEIKPCISLITACMAVRPQSLKPEMLNRGGTSPLWCMLLMGRGRGEQPRANRPYDQQSRVLTTRGAILGIMEAREFE